MTDEELIKVLYEHRDRLIATVDESGEPFHSIGTILLSAERTDGVERKIILWLEPEPLDDNWEPFVKESVMPDPIDKFHPHTYGGQEPTDVGTVIHDAVVGTQITVWFKTETGPIGIRMWDDAAKNLRNHLIDLIDNIE
jgi:hypothetical protein